MTDNSTDNQQNVEDVNADGLPKAVANLLDDQDDFDDPNNIGNQDPDNQKDEFQDEDPRDTKIEELMDTVKSQKEQIKNIIDHTMKNQNNQQSQQQNAPVYEEEVIPELSTVSKTEFKSYMTKFRSNTVKLGYNEALKVFAPYLNQIPVLVNELKNVKSMINSGVSNKEIKELDIIIKEKNLQGADDPYDIAKMFLNKSQKKGFNNKVNQRKTKREYGNESRNSRDKFNKTKNSSGDKNIDMAAYAKNLANKLNL